MPNKGRGFAGMSDRKQRQIASKGGSASGGNFKNDPARASKAGRKGGQHQSCNPKIRTGRVSESLPGLS